LRDPRAPSPGVVLEERCRVGHRSRSFLFVFAAGYFACYVPYSAIAKALATPGIRDTGATTGLALLPIMTLASLLAMFVTISLLGWWRYARPAGARWPRPNRWTLLSGISTAAILVTTTLAYTFDGVSLTFVMLVMRGGVLVIAPVVDGLTGRRIRWFSWVALGLSIASLASAFATREGAIPLLCAIDLALYLAGYVVRLRLMARLGKSEDPAVRRRYFVEEQMVATPVAVALLAALAAIGPASLHEPLRAGFTDLWADSTAAWLVLAGVCSQGTGVFGGLLLLDASETSYCVPLNRASSILGGVVASALLAALFAVPPPSTWELLGALTLVAAIAVLWLGPRMTGPILDATVRAPARSIS
jgi:drug/metabolite transporter (DMT)-like permease